MSTGPLGTNFSEIWIKIQTFSFTKMHLKLSSAKWPFCPGGDELAHYPLSDYYITGPCNHIKADAMASFAPDYKLSQNSHEWQTLLFKYLFCYSQIDLSPVDWYATMINTYLSDLLEFLGEHRKNNSCKLSFNFQIRRNPLFKLDSTVNGLINIEIPELSQPTFKA